MAETPPPPPGYTLDKPSSMLSDAADYVGGKIERFGQDAYGAASHFADEYTAGYGPVISAAIARSLGAKQENIDRVQSADRAREGQFAQDDAVGSFVVGTAGMLSNPLTAMVGHGAGKLLGKIPTAGRALASAATGGTLMAADASGHARPGGRLDAAESAFIPGAAMGGALHAGIGAAAPVLARKFGGAESIEKRALDYIRPRVKGDPKMTPAGLATTRAERTTAGMRGPTAAHEVSGPGLPRIASVAARKGDAAKESAEEFMFKKAGNLPVDTTERLKAISDHPHSVKQRVEAIDKQMRERAAKNYREPWKTPVKLDEPTMKILAHPETRPALANARRTASVHPEDPESVNHMRDIAKVEDYSTEVEKHVAEVASYPERLKAWQNGGGYDIAGIKLPEARALAENVLKEQPPVREHYSPEQNAAVADEVAQRKAVTLERLGAKKIAPPPEPGPPPEPPTVSAGALHRVQMALHDKGASMMSEAGETDPEHRIGAGIVENFVKPIEAHLDKIPELEAANADFKEHISRIDALSDKGVTKVLDANPADFKEYFDKLSPEAVKELRIGIRDTLKSAAQGKTGNALGVLEKLVSGDYGQQNLSRVMGADEAGKLRDWARLARSDLARSRAIGGVGSRTSEDLSEGDKVLHHAMQMSLGNPAGAARHALNKLISGGWVMSEAEAQAILKLSQGEPEELLRLLDKEPHSTLGTTLQGALVAEFGAAHFGPQHDQYSDEKAIEDAQAADAKLKALDAQVPTASVPMPDMSAGEPPQ